MSPELLGLLTSVTFACGHALARQGLIGSDSRTTTLVNAASQGVFLWSLSLALVPLSGLKNTGVLFFVVDGLTVPALARWLLFYGMNRIGLSRATSIAGIAPLFSFTIALALLREEFTLIILEATISIVLGVVLVAKKKEEAPWRGRDIIFPIMAAIIWAISPNLRKLGLQAGVHPLVGGAVSASVSVVVMASIITFSAGWKGLKFGIKATTFQLLSGLTHGLAVLFYIYALQGGKVIVVAPLANSTALFTLPLALLFFRGREGITRYTVLGTFLIVFGIFALFAR